MSVFMVFEQSAALRTWGDRNVPTRGPKRLAGQVAQPLLRIARHAAGRQVHAAVAQVAQGELDHAAAVLGGEAVERAPERVREVRLVQHAALVQRLDQHDVGRREAGQRIEERLEVAAHQESACGGSSACGKSTRARYSARRVRACAMRSVLASAAACRISSPSALRSSKPYPCEKQRMLWPTTLIASRLPEPSARAIASTSLRRLARKPGSSSRSAGSTLSWMRPLMRARAASRRAHAAARRARARSRYGLPPSG